MNKELTVIGIGVILIMVSIMMWLSYHANGERDQFEAGVLMQHGDFHRKQQEMNDALKQYIDAKSDDRFRGSDGAEMELRLQTQIDSLHQKVDSVR